MNPELLLGGKYGHALHVWDLHKRRHLQKLDLGPSSRWCSSCGRRTNPTKAYGFVGVVISLKDLSSSIWMWYREGQRTATARGRSRR